MNIEQLTNASVNFDGAAIEEEIKSIRSRINALDESTKYAWLIKAAEFLDLTTLGVDYTPEVFQALCVKVAPCLTMIQNLYLQTQAYKPPKSRGKPSVQTAAVCVYPMRFLDAKAELDKLDPEHKISRATVAGGSPSGMTTLQTRVREVEIAVELGADEIDRLINRRLGLAQKCPLLYAELMSVLARSPDLVMIRPTGDLDCLKNVYQAALMAMLAGADFIKTSTGKLTVNATLPMGIVMCRAIKDYYKHTGRKVGLNLDRGIKEPQDALEWMLLVQTELGKEWLTKDLFKFGESKLLDYIDEEINSD